jgi:hypothetical protein
VEIGIRSLRNLCFTVRATSVYVIPCDLFSASVQRLGKRFFIGSMVGVLSEQIAFAVFSLQLKLFLCAAESA